MHQTYVSENNSSWGTSDTNVYIFISSENDEVWRTLSRTCSVLRLILEYFYIGQIAKRRISLAFAFNLQNTTKHSTRSGSKADKGLVCLFAICLICRYIPICTQKEQYNTKYTPLHHSWTYTNVCIGIRSMLKCHFNRTALIKCDSFYIGPKVKSRKYQGVFEVKSRAKTWQVREIPKITIKQKRSTKGFSKLKRSVNITSSEKNGLNIRTNASHKFSI